MLEKISDHHYRISGVLDIQHTESLRELIELGEQSTHHLTLDCQDLESTDSLLLAAILCLARDLERKQGTLTIRHFPRRLAGLAKAYGIDTLIDRYCAKDSLP